MPWSDVVWMFCCTAAVPLSCLMFRDRPATIQIEVKSIDDTSNFDEFPDIDLKWREFDCTVVFFQSKHICPGPMYVIQQFDRRFLVKLSYQVAVLIQRVTGMFLTSFIRP